MKRSERKTLNKVLSIILTTALIAGLVLIPNAQIQPLLNVNAAGVNGSPVIVKTVNGVNIASKTDIDLSQITFEAFLGGVKYADGLLNSAGEIEFYPALESGNTYRITESMGSYSDLFVAPGVVEISIEGDIVEIVEYKTTTKYVSDETYGTLISATAGENGQNWNLPNVWDGALRGRADNDERMAYEKLVEMGAKWIWNTENTYQFGVTGGIFETKIDVFVDEAVTVPFYFAADNVAAVYVNGRLAFYTNVALDGRGLADDYSETVFGQFNYCRNN